jgi:hypothetical protein
VAGSVAYDGPTRTATFTPDDDLEFDTVYAVTVSGAEDAAGNVMATDTWGFTTVTPLGCPCSIFPPSTVPGNPAENDSSAVELGVKFQSAVDGFVTGIRFYKGNGNSGTHVGTLWSDDGDELASVTFTNETATGWQQAIFDSPVPVVAGTTYVASYHAPNGRYAVDEGDEGGFDSAVTNGPLTALASGSSGGNGVYAYGNGGFPTNTYAESNYYVDVVFTTDGEAIP